MAKVAVGEFLAVVGLAAGGIETACRRILDGLKSRYVELGVSTFRPLANVELALSTLMCSDV